MKVITKIGRQKNNQERYNIYLNDEYAFAVDESTLIKFGLMKGKTLEQFDIDEIAYVRFASVYRQFKDINTFMSELKKLLTD